MRGLLLVVAAASVMAASPPEDTPPRASLIRISAPAANGEVVVTGAAGAARASTDLTLINLASRHMKTTKTAADGSFEATIFGAAGTQLYLRTASYATPGTILRVADPVRTGVEVPFSGAGLSGLGTVGWPVWRIEGTLSAGQFQPGQTLRVNATIWVDSPVVAGITPPRVNGQLRLEQVAGPDGFQAQAHSAFASAMLTPTGLPIERDPPGRANAPMVTMVRTGDTRVEARLEMSLTIPADLPAGYYAPLLNADFQNLPEETAVGVTTEGTGQRVPRSALQRNSFLYLPLIRVGNPAQPRLAWTLLTDDLSGASRGVRAVEDRQRFGVAPKIVTNSDVFVIPSQDAAGARLTYRLEPFAPAVSISDRGIAPEPAVIPLRFPSGRLSVEIRRPDGTAVAIGPAAFQQSRAKQVVDRGTGRMIDLGGPILSEVYELSTMDPRFEVQFTQEGLHTIKLEGEVEDIWGNVWRGGGTYEVYVARALSLDTAVLPGMVFETGDVFNSGLTLTPPVPATVDVRFRLAPNSDPTRMIERRVQGEANRFGYFHGPGAGIALEQAGEYRVDVIATYRDAQGNLWMASRTWGGVVAPRDTPLIAHGKRGIDQSRNTRPQWFFRSQTEHPDHADGSHVQFPFHSGDVMWMTKSDSTIPQVTFQDTQGSVLAALRARESVYPFAGIGNSVIGETPLFSSTADGLDAHVDPSRVDIWGYSYSSVQRPLVRVREVIREDSIHGYWRFSDRYGAQIGMGPDGDLENDIKFQYGGVVLRGSGVGGAHYAIYGSLFVLVPNNDPLGGTRVFPPFQGNGGGPTGGPVMKLKGKDVDLFLHPTAVRPGSVLEVGDTFAMAGAVGPTLAGLVSYSVTSPGGRVRQFSGRANKVGYYYRAADDFVVQEPGVYTVDLKVTYDGLTSAGQVTAPFPSGDVLGTVNGRFFVYVVARNSAPLTVETGNFNFTAAVPRVQVTATMPGFHLETKDVSGSYRFDVAALNRDFPNLDVRLADVVTITMFDPATNRARVLVYHGPEFFSTAQTPQPPAPAAAANAASYSPALSPGSLAALFGEHLAGVTATAPGIPLPVALGGATVQLNGIAAPLYYASPTQINFQVPWELAGQTQASLSVSGSAPVTVQLAGVSPGIFAVVRQGGFLILYCTGLGDVSSRPATGAGASTTVLSNTVATPMVTIGGQAARVVFSGLAPGFAGLYQVNVEIPGVSGAVVARVTAGGRDSNAVHITVD